jgi:ADP-ribose pyrophosphatase YjhB (NUDIX family)
MNHRISAGALVVEDGRLLMVRHRKPGEYDFWVAPGGGVIGTESLAQAAEREVREETGLEVLLDELVYVEEFHSPDTRHCKFWFCASVAVGELSTHSAEATAEFIVEAAWHTEADLKDLQIFPEALRGRFWRDRERGFTGLQHLGQRAMQFW